MEVLMKEAVVVSAVRTAVGKAPRGILKDTRPDDIGALIIKEAVARVPGLKVEEIDDFVIGCAFPESDQGLNLARVVSHESGFPFYATRANGKSFLFLRTSGYCNGGL